jgi:hypothetical protein
VREKRPAILDTNIARLIHAAGSAEDDMERLRLLRQLDARAELDATLRADLAKLLPVVEDWANGRSRVVVDTSRAAENGFLCRFITGRVRPASEGPVHPPEPSEGSPLRPIWCLYRGRMLIWQVIQSSPLLSVKERRENYYGEGRCLLEETSRAFPENRVVRRYLGEPAPWPNSDSDARRSGASAERRHPPTRAYPANPAAPVWANLQREGLEKLADVIHWWVVERQLPDGQFGGGWGDDVEMWRWWTPVSGFLSDALAKYRLLTGDTQHDALLRTDVSGYVRYRLTGDGASLESALRRNAEAFRANWEAYTSEMRWTDRVMSFTRNYLNHLPEPAPPAPSPDILYSTATGDPGNPLVFPLYAVRWRTPPRDIAALVTESSRTSFAAELCHFGDQPRDLDAELFLLSPGEYELTLSLADAADSSPLQHRAFRVEGPRAQVSLLLPARRLCVVRAVAR